MIVCWIYRDGVGAGLASALNQNNINIILTAVTPFGDGAKNGHCMTPFLDPSPKGSHTNYNLIKKSKFCNIFLKIKQTNFRLIKLRNRR